MPQLSSVLIVCSRMDEPGGTERAIVNLASLLDAEGHIVTLLIADETDRFFYSLPPSIRVVHEPVHFGITEKGNLLTRKWALLQHVARLKDRFRALQPDIIIGTEYHLTIASRWAGSGFRVIGWEHHHLYWLKKNRFWTFLHRHFYRRLNRVVCNNAREQDLFRRLGCATTVIPYSLPGLPDEQAALNTHTILTIGWLIKRKGIDLLPQIAEAVLNAHPGWTWKLIGKGELRDWLLEEIRKRGLDGRLLVEDPVSGDIGKEYQKASIQVMLSRFECLPMVLLEGSSYGIPMVAFDCPTGPGEIILQGKSGFVVPMEDQQGFIDALSSLMENEGLRRQMGTVARQSSQRYQRDTVYQKWAELFNELSVGNQQP